MKLPVLPSRWPRLLLVLLIVQAPLIFNPGWFSHDELQWAARADVAHFRDLPWVPWGDLAAFQYRPLTFNLWLVLSWLAFATPWLMHGLFVMLGSINALLIAAVLRAAAVPSRTAAAAAIVFVLTPYVVYVHGWVGTLADLLVLLAGLGALRLLQVSAHAPWARQAMATVLVALLVAMALLAKESAIVLPALLLPALYRHPRPRRALAMIALASLPVLGYLALRFATLLGAPGAHEGYAWAWPNLPARLAEYLLFPFMPSLFEVGTTLAKSPARLAAAAACLAALLAALAWRGWRWPLAWLALVVALLTPVLILATSSGQYAYLASAAAVGLAAAAWPRLARAPRIALSGASVVVIVHGLAVMAAMVQVGQIQHRFDADLRAILASGIEAPAIAPAADARAWMLRRFLHQVPRYAGARIAQPGQAPRYIMQRNGHLLPAPAQASPGPSMAPVPRAAGESARRDQSW
ncbi:hypothetical protein [Dokdonella sp.]|uniref:hypothetical protein n=1 Tax=Dokdonella sp. TaxID=2291710 RepID=UPI0031BE6DAA|nr:hypothetical protein [Dokdonella sp.]